MSFKQKYSQAIVNKVHELSATNSVRLISEAMNLSERTVRYILRKRHPNIPQDVLLEAYNEGSEKTETTWEKIKKILGIS